MNYAESILDRHLFTTDTNEYATGLNDENGWEESILDYGISLEDEEDDLLMNPDIAKKLYNETGYNRLRVN